MTTLHFVGGEKGGVGKSVFSRVLAQYFIDNGEAFAGFDADSSHQTLTRFYGQFSQSVDLLSFEQTDIIMEKAFSESVQAVIDLPAQSQRFLNEWLLQNDVLEFCKENDVKVMFWFVADDGRDSSRLAKEFLECFGDEVPVVLVKNFGRGRNFSAIETVVADYEGCQSIELAELYAATMQKIDVDDLDFWAAANDATSSMGLMERQRVKIWLKRCFTAVNIVLQDIETSQEVDEP